MHYFTSLLARCAKKSALVVYAACAATLLSISALAAEPIKIGVMLPFTGTYAKLGENITDGLKLAIEQNGGQLGGRDVEYVVVDSEAKPDKAPTNMQKLVSGEHVDFVVGPVHSGVGMGMLKIARDEDTILLIPNAGFGAATGALCAPNVFRTSFTMWQTAYPMGKVLVDRGIKKVVTMTWNYAAGKDGMASFKEGFEEAGGEVVKQLWVPFPKTEFQSQLTQIAAIKPDAVFVFFAGGGAVKFVKDYKAAGLMDSIPLTGIGFLTEGTLTAQGDSAEGILSTLHYADELDNPANHAFQEAFKTKTGRASDVYAVQGYDTGLTLVGAMQAVAGNTDDRPALIKALEAVEVDSPRGAFTYSKAHHPSQNIYLREVKNGENVVLGLAAEQLADHARGCSMMN